MNRLFPDEHGGGVAAAVKAAVAPVDEARRLAALHALQVLDTPPVPELDRITRLAARLFKLPMAAVSLVDSEREWFLARHGLEPQELPREHSFCTHAIQGRDLLVVEDARRDPRFRDNPLVTGDPHIGFYAGQCLFSRQGHALGTLCVVGQEPRCFTAADAEALADLGALVQDYFQQREAELQARALGQDNRLMARELRASELRYTALFNNQTFGIAQIRIVTDGAGRPVDYCVEAMNGAGARILGMSCEAFEGRPITSVYPGIADFDFDFIAAYGRVALDGGEDHFEVFFPPSAQWLSIYAYRSQPGECIVLFTDISAQRQVQGALGENEAVLRATFEQAGVGIAHVAPDGRFLKVNRKFADMTGYGMDELCRLRYADINYAEDINIGQDLFRQALAGTLSTFTVEKRYVRRDGELMWVRITAAAVHEAPGRPLRYLVGVFEDITERKRAEEALRRERARLQAILDNAPLFISIKDLDGRITLANRELCEKLDVPPPEAITGRSVFELFPPAVAEALWSNDRAALAADAPVKVEEVVQHRDGSWHTYFTLKFPVRDCPDSPPFGICAISTDITPAKRAEAERQKLMDRLEATAINADRSRAQLAAVFEAIEDGIAVFDMQGNLVMLNRALASLNRFASVEEMQRNLAYFSRLYEFTRSDGLRLPLEQWPAMRVLQGETINEWELQVRRLDIGQSWYFSFSGAPVHDENGRQMLALVIVRDITARKALEHDLQQAHRELETRVEKRTAELQSANAALRQEQERSRLVLETATDAYIACNEHGVITDWNRAAEKLFGWSRAEILGRVLTDTVIPQYTRRMLRASLDQFRRAGGDDSAVLNHILEIAARRRSGEEFPAEISLAANRFGEHWTISVFLRDISERRQGEAALRKAHDELAQSLAAEQAAARAAESARLHAEEAMLAAEAANRAKSDFLATMSHEIRTPLNGVIGFNGLLLDGPLNEDKRRYAEMARQSGEYLLHLLNDFLDFSKIEAGHLELEPLEFDPRLEVGHTLSLVRSTAEQKGLRLVSSFSAPPRVRGDAARLRQILLNLLSNAVKFTESGEVTLSCEETGRSEGRVRLCFQVTDTGIGIPLSARRRLFQPFSQADASTTRKYGGTGLGLAICKRLAEAMGGGIGCDSTPGEGSSFWVELPFELVASEAEEAAEPLPEVAAGADATPRGRVLVVEDNPVSQLMVREMLKRLGCRVDVAGNGMEAVEAVRRLPYDLIFMDCDMPVMNGFDATRAIRVEEARQRRVPIVAITASALKGDSERCFAVGMDDFMSKPIRLQDLARMVDTWLGRVEA